MDPPGEQQSDKASTEPLREKATSGESDKESDKRDEHGKSQKKRNAPSGGEPLIVEGEQPQKRYFRQRAHCNPLSHNDSYQYPTSPQDTDWLRQHYPELEPKRTPTVLDVGCGFGGLTLALATLLPQEVILGMEIRAKVSEYVRLRIVASRKEHPGQYQNCSVLRTNSMKYLVNYCPKASVQKIFFCFPDPHFKRKNYGRRIISKRLLSEYAYILQPGKGRLYCITDVQELHEWHIQQCDAHPLFRRLSDNDLDQDPCVTAMIHETEEGKKVQRAGGDKYHAVYERILDKDIERFHVGNFFPTAVEGGATEDVECAEGEEA